MQREVTFERGGDFFLVADFGSERAPMSDAIWGAEMQQNPGQMLNLSLRSIAKIMELAMSIPVAFSMPSSPGEEFTSSRSGPLTTNFTFLNKA